jgi:hypothetical protein
MNFMDNRTDRMESEQNKTIVYIRADQYIVNKYVCEKKNTFPWRQENIFKNKRKMDDLC